VNNQHEQSILTLSACGALFFLSPFKKMIFKTLLHL